MAETEGDVAPAGRWQMWALRTDDHWPKDPGFFVYAFPDRRYPQAHADKGVSAVEVTVELDDSGGYWAWIGGAHDYPEFIFHRRLFFDMCFAYGPQAEVDAGRGSIVRVSVVESHPAVESHPVLPGPIEADHG